jgi:hypothetical protein
MSTLVTSTDYEEAVESYTGFCASCLTFTREDTELDADGYDCPVCGENVVMGAENALVAGLIEVES